MDRREIDYLTSLTLKASERHGVEIKDVLTRAFDGLETIDTQTAKDRLLQLIKE